MKAEQPLRPDEIETEAISTEELARLANAASTRSADEQAIRQELERSKTPTEGSAWPPILDEPRRRMDTRYADPATSHRPVVGPVLVAAKRGFRAAFQPFINEMLRRQVEFNEAILTSLAGIYEQVRVNARTQALWRDELMERLDALERKPSNEASTSRARSPKRKTKKTEY